MNCSRLDLEYSVIKLSRYIHNPGRDELWIELHKIIRLAILVGLVLSGSGHFRVDPIRVKFGS